MAPSPTSQLCTHTSQCNTNVLLPSPVALQTRCTQFWQWRSSTTYPCAHAALDPCVSRSLRKSSVKTPLSTTSLLAHPQHDCTRRADMRQQDGRSRPLSLPMGPSSTLPSASYTPLSPSSSPTIGAHVLQSTLEVYYVGLGLYMEQIVDIPGPDWMDSMHREWAGPEGQTLVFIHCSIFSAVYCKGSILCVVFNLLCSIL